MKGRKIKGCTTRTLRHCQQRHCHCSNHQRWTFHTWFRREGCVLQDCSAHSGKRRRQGPDKEELRRRQEEHLLRRSLVDDNPLWNNLLWNTRWELLWCYACSKHRINLAENRTQGTWRVYLVVCKIFSDVQWLEFRFSSQMNVKRHLPWKAFTHPWVFSCNKLLSK